MPPQNFNQGVIDALKQINRRIRKIELQEGSPTFDQAQSVAFVDLPTVTVQNGRVRWCSNCRKTGEGAGVGTGVLVYSNATTTNWKRVSDDVNAAI